MNSREAFTEAIAAEKLIVVDFFVPWCVACRRFHPALIKLAAKHPDCTFLAVRHLIFTTVAQHTRLQLVSDRACAVHTGCRAICVLA